MKVGLHTQERVCGYNGQIELPLGQEKYNKLVSLFKGLSDAPFSDPGARLTEFPSEV